MSDRRQEGGYAKLANLDGCPIYSVAPCTQTSKPHRGTPSARGFTAKVRTELPFIRRHTDAHNHRGAMASASAVRLI